MPGRSRGRSHYDVPHQAARRRLKARPAAPADAWCPPFPADTLDFGDWVRMFRPLLPDLDAVLRYVTLPTAEESVEESAEQQPVSVCASWPWP